MILRFINRSFISCRISKLTNTFPALNSCRQSHHKLKEMKYILVTGGVISGVGKGVIASSFGTLLDCCGISVTSLKIDPYINIDAGTFSPYEHGEWGLLFKELVDCSFGP